MRTFRTLCCAAMVLAAGILLSCEPSPRNDAGVDATPPAELSREGGEDLPEAFGVGRVPDADEIARLDIDVRPDGTGLPAGGGTAAEGAEVYAARCASCHGADGRVVVPAGGGALVAEGDKHAFVGGDDPEAFSKRTVGNYWPYAPTLFDYVRRAMPLDRPGSLTDDEVYAVVAWILWRNDLVGREEVVDRDRLPRIEMPARDRFVPDDRPGSSETR